MSIRGAIRGSLSGLPLERLNLLPLKNNEEEVRILRVYLYKALLDMYLENDE